MNKYKVAIIGCGGRGSTHASAIKSEKRCEVVAIVDIKTEAAEKLNSDNDFGAKIYTDYKEMLIVEKPDVTVIALWTPLHFQVFKDCAESGVKVVFSEKPMSPTWGESVEMTKIAERTGCQLSFSHQRRFAPGNLNVRKLLNEGLIGKIERMDLYAGMNLLDCGTHTFDQAFSFINDAPAKWVLGAVDTTDTINWFDVRSEKLAVGAMVYENGISANIYVGESTQKLVNGVRIYGENGFLEVGWEGDIQRGAVYNDPTWKVPKYDKDVPETNLFRAFPHIIDCYEAGKESVLSYKNALRAAEIIFAFYESVRTRAVVHLPVSGFTDNPFITMYENGKSFL
jgi:UDP-N-acetyl-2-amino-2-deoxyglucuronate dehydrogenase